MHWHLSLCIIVGALQLWWIISWLQYFFGVLYLRCVPSLVLCICTFGMLCIGIFGGASLVRFLLCNASLVHCFLVLGAIYFWCCIFGAMHCQLYRAGLLPQWRIYFMISSSQNEWIFGKKKESVQIDITYVIISDYDEVTKLRCQDKGMGTGWLLREVPLQKIFIGALGRWRAFAW